MRVLFIFLDGIGLGVSDPSINPLARAKMPHLNRLLDGRPLTKDLLAIDPNVGVKGLPQSATGQAILLTGLNVSELIGYHYGPKPNPDVSQYLKTETIFSRVVAAGKKTALLSAYPPRYFDGINSGKRIYSSIPMAYTNAGHSLFTQEDLFAGRALPADFTGEGWRSMLGIPETPVRTSYEAGQKLASLAMRYDFSMFEYWASDYAGHKQMMDRAVQLMESIDEVLGGLVDAMDKELIVVITSDHGNMEDMSTRKHTSAHVPALVIGEKTARDRFTADMTDLTHITPAIWQAVSY